VKRFKFLGGHIHVVYSIDRETKLIVFFQNKWVCNCWVFPWLDVFSASRTALHSSAGFWTSRSEERLNEYILPLTYFTYHTGVMPFMKTWSSGWLELQIGGHCLVQHHPLISTVQ
jgi:hypothetical protein